MWLVIALVTLAYNKFEYLKCLIYKLSFVYESSMVLILSSSRSRNCFSLRLNAWKVICQFLIISLHSSFLLKSYNVFDGDMGIRLNFFVLLSANACKNHLVSLELFQNLMKLCSCLLKNNLRFFRMAIHYY